MEKAQPIYETACTGKDVAYFSVGLVLIERIVMATSPDTNVGSAHVDMDTLIYVATTSIRIGSN